MSTFEITIDEMAKIEGKASLAVKVTDGKIEKLEFIISEYKRFYTQAIVGADVVGLPQLTARICGTCSNAHILCAIKAVEHGLGIHPTAQVQKLRELLNFGLLIRDHALHLYVFTLPDMLGVDNILEIDETNPANYQLLSDCFEVKAVGNNLSKAIGGRSVHAPRPTVGSFLMLPDAKQFPDLIAQMEKIRPMVLRLIHVFLSCDFSLERPDLSFAALLDDSFSFLSGEIHTSDGAQFPQEEFGKYLTHIDIGHSEASGYRFNGKTYMVGALARINLGKEFLHPRTREDAKEALSKFPSKNIFYNNLAQAIEILHAIDSSIDILKTLGLAPEPLVPVVRHSGEGIGVIEAPRGTLYYKLSIDDKGKVLRGDIVVPTGQNQIGIEESIRAYLEGNLDKDKEVLSKEVEKIVRAYDPCMSCASHFLKIKWMV